MVVTLPAKLLSLSRSFRHLFTLNRLIRYGVVVVYVAAATILTQFLFGDSGVRASSLLFILAVILSTVTSGWKAGIVATVLSTMVTMFAIFQFSGSVSYLQQVRLAVFLIEGAIISLIWHSVIRAKYVAEQKSLQLAQSHQELQDAHGQIEQTFERISDAFVALDAEWSFTYLNSKAEELLQQPRESLIGKNVWKTFGIEKSWQEYKKATLAMDTQKTVTFETYFLPVQKWLSVRCYPSLNGMSIFFEDITSDKKAAASLQSLQQQLGVLAQSPVVGILFADLTGGISYANDYFLQLIGYTKQELVSGKIRWDELTPIEWHLNDKEAIELAKKFGSCPPFEKEFIHKNGSRIPVVIGFALSGEKQDLAIAFVLDMTKSKQLERQKDEFVSVASHELKTPVTSLKSYAQVLHKHFVKVNDQASAERLVKMTKQIDRLTGLIRDLLDVSKIQAGQMLFQEEHVDVVSLMTELIEDLQLTTEHRIELTSPAESVVIADRERLGQVITNLLENAIKYSPAADRVVVSIIDTPEAITVGVQDFGIGIAKKYQHELFNRFYRVISESSHTFSGLGLGLFISSEIIRRLGGRIWVESEEGKGSTFWFELQKKNID